MWNGGGIGGGGNAKCTKCLTYRFCIIDGKLLHIEAVMNSFLQVRDKFYFCSFYISRCWKNNFICDRLLLSDLVEKMWFTFARDCLYVTCRKHVLVSELQKIRFSRFNLFLLEKTCSFIWPYLRNSYYKILKQSRTSYEYAQDFRLRPLFSKRNEIKNVILKIWRKIVWNHLRKRVRYVGKSNCLTLILIGIKSPKLN